MADLAGFDVIAEGHIETVIDLINDLAPITNPQDGETIRLLGGPFSTDLNVNLGALGIVTVRVILNATIQPVIHQSLARLLISISGGSTSVMGRSLSHMGGQATVPVQMSFKVVPPAVPASIARQHARAGFLTGPPAPPGLQVPVLLLTGVSPDVVLDGMTRGLADATFGQGGADLLTSGLKEALAVFLALYGTVQVPVAGFKVLPGVDSNDPLQLSAAPTVAWIDATTLGVFGYYRAAAQGGDVTAKTTSDIVQENEEFFYDQPGAVSVLPGRSSAASLPTSVA